MREKYLCGIDLGTNSCGFCVTNQDGKIVRKNGKDLWGVRLFEESEDCSNRRSFRADRRRLQRRKHRLDLLKDLFAPEIEKVDKKFFIRLTESQLHIEDKTTNCKYVLFSDKGFTDKDYYTKYPTIYHLRKDLLDSNEKKDIRLIYIALAHMIKYRGHFLFEGAKFNSNDKSSIISSFDILKNKVNSIYPDDNFNCFDSMKIDDVIRVYRETHGINKQKEEFQKLLNPDNNKFVKDVLISLLAGGKVSTTKFISDETLIDEKKNISCDDEDYDVAVQNLIKVENEEEQNKVSCLIEIKKIYDYLLLNKLLKDSKYISEAMVKIYDEHKEDLAKLKAYVKKNAPKEYNKLFREIKEEAKKSKDKINNYPAYIGSSNSSLIKKRIQHCKKEDFYKLVKSILKIDNIKNADAIDNSYLKEVYIKISEGNYLPRQNSSSNRVLPYQLNLQEMEKILNEQSKYYSFLNEKDEFGTIKDKIISILKFKIPYYVGPLSGEKNSKYSWVIREDKKIYPWNFNNVVDVDKTAEQFIKRMLNKCSYLADQYCLPKDSILFSYYNVLNEVNKLYVNGSPITKDDKQLLFEEVYSKKRKVTSKMLCETLSAHHNNEVIELTTSNDKEAVLHSNMKSFVDFCSIFGEKYVKEHVDLIDEIIADSAIFEDKKMLEKRLDKKYHFDQDKIKKIKSLTFNGFGTLSKKLLTEIRGVSSEGEVLENNSIINVMQNTNMNFMEVINSEKYGFNVAIKDYNSEFVEESDNSYKDFIDKAYVSPGMKRPLIQAYRIIEELEKIIKHPIDEYYIECTRSNKERKVAKESRKEKLKKMYDDAKNVTGEINKRKLIECHKKLDELIEKINNGELSDDYFRSDAVYLYFTQLGRDIYTGKEIDFDDISNRKLYDIDHIFPQSLVKDDSMDNRVLVSNAVNSEKSDIYPIPYSKFSGDFNHQAFQKMLLENKLISEKKYARLTRMTPLDEPDIYNFVSRQIIYTSQSVKALKDLILTFKKNRDGEVPKVVLSKAEIVSDYRNDYDLLKSRDANDCHHAHDAFLNILLGRTINTYFGENLNRINYIREHNLSTNPKRIFMDTKDRIKKDLLDSSGNLVWRYKDDETKNYIDKEIKTNHNMLFSIRTYYKTSLFSKTSITPAKDVNQSALPLKQIKEGPLSALSDKKKYGGYSDLSFGSYTLFKAEDKKGKEIFVLVAIPTIISKENNTNAKIQYAINSCNLINPVVIVDGLKINTCITQGNSSFCITGKSLDNLLITNTKEAFFDYDSIRIIRKVSKLNGIMADFKNTFDKSTYDITSSFKEHFNSRIIDEDTFILQEKTQKKNLVLITREEIMRLYQTIINQLHNKIYEQYSIIQTNLKLIEKEETKQRIKKINMFALSYLVGQMLYLTQVNSVKSNLEIIGGAKTSGTLSISNNLKDNMRIMAYSVTGFYKKVLWEKK